MKNILLKACGIGLAVNFFLFCVKLYVGLSANSLAVYCDAVNNLGDTFSCALGIFSGVMAVRLNARSASRLQSLCGFVIGLLIAATGIYFVYNGIQRLMYPLPVAYSHIYAVVIAATIGVKSLLGFAFLRFYRNEASPVLKALATDCFLDACITASILVGLVLAVKVNYALDGVLAVISGTAITVSAIKNLVREATYLVND